MSKDTHFKPFLKEHGVLKDITDGKKHLVVDMEKIKELVQDDDPAEIAQEIYEAEIACQGVYTSYIKIQEPTLENGTWHVRKVLTDLGMQVFSTLDGGVLWNNQSKGPDYPETYKWYEAMMDKGSFDMRYAELIIENKSEELRDLRNKLVYFKMRGNREGDKIKAISDAA